MLKSTARPILAVNEDTQVWFVLRFLTGMITVIAIILAWYSGRQ